MIVAAIESVLAQNYPHFEHIIVDGGSTDGTLELLKRFPQLKVVVNHDKGMYNALNRGLELAKGEIIGFLNTDDLYGESVFAIIAEKFKNSKTMAVVGSAQVFVTTPNGEIQIIDNLSPDSASLIELSTLGNHIFNAWFFRRSVFEKIGNFNIEYRIVGDREFMLRFLLANLHYELLNKQVYRYLQHDGSLTFNLSDQKYERIVNEHIKMTGYYLEQKELPQTARALIQQLRTRETIKMTVIAAKTSLRKGYYFFIEGIKYDPKWPFRFVQKAIKYIKRSPKFPE
ncbi:MAG: glycosyltransferase [Anaerolineales bacterium]|nr:glycosyltransferase [Anaerolineales bacterium]